MKKPFLPSIALLLVAACNQEQPVDYAAQTTAAMHAAISVDLDGLVLAAQSLQDAAHTPAGRGWDATLDAAEIQAMKDAWVDARVAYEHVEGALAPLFPDLDAALDARYDDFLVDIGPDTDLFDGEGVTGMHAAERIIFADVIPADVIELESTLPGYEPAAFPATEAEAIRFKEELLGRLVADATALRDAWTPANIDLAGAFTGLIDLMNEQHEKVNKAGDQEEESRYAQRTMADLRANLEGTRNAYAAFQPWLQSLEGGAAIDLEIEAGFADLDAAYAVVDGDAFPAPPATWSSESPSAADLATPFGQLYSAVGAAVDPNADGSIVFAMNEAAELMGLTL